MQQELLSENSSDQRSQSGDRPIQRSSIGQRHAIIVIRSAGAYHINIIGIHPESIDPGSPDIRLAPNHRIAGDTGVDHRSDRQSLGVIDIERADIPLDIPAINRRIRPGGTDDGSEGGGLRNIKAGVHIGQSIALIIG